MMKDVNDKKTNPWQEPPVVHYETGYNVKEKVNEEIGECEMRVKITPHEKLVEAGATYGKYQLILSEKESLMGYFDSSKAEE